MSFEALVLLALFVVLPLLQQLIRAMRHGHDRLPEATERRPPVAPVRTPPPEPVVPPLPVVVPDALTGPLPSSAAVAAPRRGAPGTVARTPRSTVRQPVTVGLRTRRDLRRAMVLVAVLGPSRASSPYRSACDERTL
jgi:hypothetical protein